MVYISKVFIRLRSSGRNLKNLLYTIRGLKIVSNLISKHLLSTFKTHKQMESINFILSSAIIVAVIILAGSAILLFFELFATPFRFMNDVYKDFKENENFYANNDRTKKTPE